MVNPIRFNVDLTGINPNNRIVGEVHDLPVRLNRTIATLYGPYYTESLEVYDANVNKLLTRDVHYKCLDVVGLPTAQSGKEICTIVVITNPTVSNTVRLNYQALGGNYERTYEAIKDLIDNLTDDGRPVSWPSILNRPSSFEPSHHLHRLGDLIGFEYMVVELERLKNAVLMGDEIAHVEVLAYVELVTSSLKKLLSNSQETVTLLAVTAATRANNLAIEALARTNNLSEDVALMVNEVDNGVATLNQLAQAQVTSEANAIALLQQYQ